MRRAGVFGGAHKAASGLTLAYQTTVTNTTSLTTYTFTSVPIGSASGTRRVIVAVGTRNGSGNANPTITIGGVTASNDVTLAVDTNQQAVTIASAVVTSGTTATIVVTLGAASGRCAVSVWSLSSGSPTGNTANATTNGGTMTVTTLSGDVVIGAMANRDSASGTTFTWTGATMRFGANISGPFDFSSADTVASGSSTSLSATAADSVTPAAVAAAYR